MQTPDHTSSIAVIVVNYGTAELSAAAVQSVLDHSHHGHPVEVHLVDNASPQSPDTESDADIFARLHTERGWGERVTLWPETENHGFGRGNNVVIHALAKRAVPPDYVFLLNPDAHLANEALAILADFMDAHPKAAATGASIERPGVGAVTAAFRFPGPASAFSETVNFGPIAKMFAQKKVALPAHLPRQQVDWVSGAAVMFRLSTLCETGFFDPDFFLYFEETELMWRLHRAGGEVWYIPEARIGHVAGAATQMQNGRHQSKAQPGYWYDSWRLYHVKTQGVSGARKAALARLVGAVLHVPLQKLRGRDVSLPSNFRRDFTTYVLKPLFIGDPGSARPDGKTSKSDWIKR